MSNLIDTLKSLDLRKLIAGTCPKHPFSDVRHSWNETHAVLNGYPAGAGIKSCHRYECAVCGDELNPLDDLKFRQQ